MGDETLHMTEVRKLGGSGGAANGLTVPAKFVDELGWKGGDYIIITLDLPRKQLILKKMPNF